MNDRAEHMGLSYEAELVACGIEDARARDMRRAFVDGAEAMLATLLESGALKEMRT
jgi:hypothetical protein